MLYPQNIEQKLAFDKLRARLHDLCLSPMGREQVEQLRFLQDYEQIDRLTTQTAEMLDVLRYEMSFPAQQYTDLREPLYRLRVEGTFLSEEELLAFKNTFFSLWEVLRFFAKTANTQYTALKELLQGLVLDEYVLRRIERILDPSGRLSDHASPRLYEIRQQLLQSRQKLRKQAERILERAHGMGYTAEDAQPTIRNGRIVIPVKAEHKRRLAGFIQDESNTGQTVYIEPAELVNINNDIRELELEEKHEVIRILLDISQQIRDRLPEFEKALTSIATLDFLMAKARLAAEMDAVRPQFVEKNLIDWHEAVHPLLLFAHREMTKPVVPLSVQLNEQQRILVISGPNAGGKSIALQTVGLLQYMWQCGLLVPMKSHSTIGLFENLFIDIGDGQSIENDLSTYSAHLQNMAYFLTHAHAKTLFLIDELGVGTEPQLGGAIAEAILEALYAKGAFGVVNTHYGNIKRLADHLPAMVNAAMRFDPDHMEPLYQLVIGQAGSSYAFEIAQKMGLPADLLQRAKEKLGPDAFTYDRLLRELEEERSQYERARHALSTAQRQLEEQRAFYEKKLAEITQQRNHYIQQAKQEARQLLESVNRRIEQAIRQIRESQAEKQQIKEAKNTIEQLKAELQIDAYQEAYDVAEGDIEVGSWVRLKDAPETVGEVIEINEKIAKVLIGQLTSELKISRLEKVSRKQIRQQQRQPGKSRWSEAMHEKFKNFSYQLDLRGMRGEEALQKLMQWLDEAILVGAKELRVVHGKGDGILRRLVREQLRHYKEVEQFHDEHIERGGDGVTIIRLH